jgi:hypothetical protein
MLVPWNDKEPVREGRGVLTGGKRVALLIVGALAAILIVAQFVLARMIMSNPGSVALRRSHEHTGYLTALVVLGYVAFSLVTIASLRAEHRDPPM